MSPLQRKHTNMSFAIFGDFLISSENWNLRVFFFHEMQVRYDLKKKKEEEKNVKPGKRQRLDKFKVRAKGLNLIHVYPACNAITSINIAIAVKLIRPGHEQQTLKGLCCMQSCQDQSTIVDYANCSLLSFSRPTGRDVGSSSSKRAQCLRKDNYGIIFIYFFMI